MCNMCDIRRQTDIWGAVSDHSSLRLSSVSGFLKVNWVVLMLPLKLSRQSLGYHLSKPVTRPPRPPYLHTASNQRLKAREHYTLSSLNFAVTVCANLLMFLLCQFQMSLHPPYHLRKMSYKVLKRSCLFKATQTRSPSLKSRHSHVCGPKNEARLWGRIVVLRP